MRPARPGCAHQEVPDSTGAPCAGARAAIWMKPTSRRTAAPRPSPRSRLRSTLGWPGAFYLRTGKRLQDRLTELVVTSTKCASYIREAPTTHTANELVIRLQPDESITLTILRRIRRRNALKPVSWRSTWGDFQDPKPGRLRAAADGHGQGHLTLFMRRDELDAAGLDRSIRAGWNNTTRSRRFILRQLGPAASSAMLGRRIRVA